MTWLVFGAGISGISAIKFLRRRSYKVSLINDTPLDPKLIELVSELGANYIPTSANSYSIPENIKNVIVSPSVSKHHPIIVQSVAKSVKIWTDIELYFEYFRPKHTIAITGTNGKSTVSSMIYHVIKGASHEASTCALAGNIGKSPLDFEYVDYLILELSSYQLCHMTGAQKLDFSCVAITNLKPDHLDWHPNCKHYFDAKWSIVNHLKEDGFCWTSDQVVNTSTPSIKTRKTWVQKNVRSYTSITDQNTELALSVASTILKAPRELLEKELLSFEALKYRFQAVGVINGMKAINDSKSTNIASTIAALKSINNSVILLIGGKGKNENYGDIAQFLIPKSTPYICHLVIFGSEKQKMLSDIMLEIPERLLEKTKEQISVFSTLKDALNGLDDVIQTNKNTAFLLFSPGCASFDEFTNFCERGEFFSKKVISLVEASKKNGPTAEH